MYPLSSIKSDRDEYTQNAGEINKSCKKLKSRENCGSNSKSRVFETFNAENASPWQFDKTDP